MTRLLLLLLLLLSPRVVSADVTYVDTGDILASTASQGSFITVGAFTLMGYVKSTSSDFGGTGCWEGGQLIASNNFANFAIQRAGTNGEGLCAWQMMDDTTGPETAKAPMVPGWHHFAVRRSGLTLEIFLDGVTAGTASITGGGWPLTTDTLLVGRALLGDRLTEIKTYNVALSTEEILRQARNRLRVYENTPPTAHWTLEQCGEGSTANGVVFRDLSGNNRTVTGNSGGSGLTCVGSEFVSRPWGIQ